MRKSTETILRHLATLTAIPVWPRTKNTRQILKELQTKNPDFNVDIRTIQRSLEQLSGVFPISMDKRGRTYYWFWTDWHALTQIPAMSNSMAFALRLASEYLKPIMPPATLSVLEPYFNHADRILDDTELGRLSDRTAFIVPGLTLIPPTVSNEVQEAIFEALMTNRKVELQYRKKHEKHSKRIILNPLGIVVRAGIFYLVAASRGSEDVRHYVLHRMNTPRILDEPGEVSRDFHLADHLADDGSFAYPASDEKIALRALFRKDAGVHLTECRLAPDQRTEEQADGRLLLEAKVADTAKLRWWLAGFGSLVEVLEPLSLREEFRKDALRLAEVYEFDIGAEKRKI